MMRTIGRMLLVFGLAGVSAVLAVSETAEVYAQDDKAGNEVTIKVKTRKWARDGTGTIKYEKLPGVRIIVSQNRVKRAGSKVVNERVGTFSTDKKDGVCVIPVKAGRPLTLVYFQDKAIMPEISNLSAEDGEVHQLSIALRPIAEYLIEEKTDPNLMPAWVKIRQIERILAGIIDPEDPKDPLKPVLEIVREIAKQNPAPKINSVVLDGEFPIKPEPKTIDRRAAEYVLSIGGKVRINREAKEYETVKDLPETLFELTDVILGRNKEVGDNGLERLKGCTNLIFLQLDQTRVTNKGLAIFEGCTGLHYLALDRTAVTDLGLANFKDCKDLTYLGLYGTEVSDKGLGYFKDCSNLARALERSVGREERLLQHDDRVTCSHR